MTDCIRRRLRRIDWRDVRDFVVVAAAAVAFIALCLHSVLG
jgi:hypothetical protein